jgi:Ca2+-binding RTX toxin-like protein
MGKGNDVLVFADAGASGACTVDMGKGDDTVVGDYIEDCGGGLTVDTGPGNDVLHLLTSLLGDAVLMGGPGNDDFRFGVAGSIAGKLFVYMGAGEDTLSVEIPVGSGSLVRGGRGRDTLAEISTNVETTQVHGFELVTPID